jgi:hypothetical protein
LIRGFLALSSSSLVIGPVGSFLAISSCSFVKCPVGSDSDGVEAVVVAEVVFERVARDDKILSFMGIITAENTPSARRKRRNRITFIAVFDISSDSCDRKKVERAATQNRPDQLSVAPTAVVR